MGLSPIQDPEQLTDSSLCSLSQNSNNRSGQVQMQAPTRQRQVRLRTGPRQNTHKTATSPRQDTHKTETSQSRNKSQVQKQDWDKSIL